MTDRGLQSRHGSKPLTGSRLQKILRDRYYLGYVTYKGEEYLGRHKPLVSTELFERAQEVMDSRSGAGIRQRRHDHYLKGMLWCGECRDRGEERRLILNRSVGRRGGVYFYYFCRGRQDHVCDSRYLDVEMVEDSIVRHYAGMQLPADFIELVRDLLGETLEDEQTARDLLRQQLNTELGRIDRQEENLLDLAADGSLNSPKIRERLNGLKSKRLKIQAELARAGKGLTEGGAVLDSALDLLADPQSLYRSFGAEQRRMLNMEIFEKIYLDETGVTDHVLRDPFDELIFARDMTTIDYNPLGVSSSFTARVDAALGASTRPTEPGERPSGLLATALLDRGWSKPLMVDLRGQFANPRASRSAQVILDLAVALAGI